MKIYFVRHGESEANMLREFSNRGFKHGLTERGIQQADELARNLRGLPFTQIYASPLMRAHQTAQILGEYLEIPVEIDNALREYDCGILEGKSDPASWAQYTEVFEQWLQGRWEMRISGGESHLEIQARFIPFIKEIRVKHPHESILFVGHGGIYRAILPLILENIDFEFVRGRHIDHTVPIIAEARTAGLFCTQWGKLNFGI